jgi:hypothetical protein
LKIAVTGGTGFIGKRLVRHLREKGDEVWIISRSAASGHPHDDVPVISWDGLKQAKDKLEGLDAIVNLAGEPISQRWTKSAKKRIVDSRREAAERLAEFTASLEQTPGVVVNSSGISIYGTSETEKFDETSPPRLEDFLSEVAAEWERAADAIPAQRIVKLRTGVVLGREGGALPKMALPYKLMVGGNIGNGRQPLSWIHIDDLARAIRFCIERTTIQGPVNATAPHPVTNREFGRALGRALRRPHWLPLPGFALRAALGEMAELLLKGQYVIPSVLLSHGFSFAYPEAGQALEQIYGSSRA